MLCIKLLFILLWYFFIAVSKTVEELILEWKKENPVSIGNLGMSQFELENIRTDTCEESFQMGQIGKYGMEFSLNNM